MLQSIPQVERFKEQLRTALRQETAPCRALTVAKQAHVYTSGDEDGAVYVIESGQSKTIIFIQERDLNMIIPQSNYKDSDSSQQTIKSQRGFSYQGATHDEDYLLHQTK